MTRMLHLDPFALRELLGPDAAPARRAITGEQGVALPPLVNHHVHLHLFDPAPLAEHGVAAVVDLGGDPVALARRHADGIPRVAYAGAFLTAPGGYPVGRSWAPDAISREVRSTSTLAGAPGGARTAVDEQAGFGASVIKVSLNATAGPVFGDDVLAAIVAAAREHELPVVAHVEGEGMAARAIAAGADVLAHAPFSEPLDDELVAAAVAQGQRWISTLCIHGPVDREVAVDNVARFAAAGGRVLYGTDLGNGDQPIGVDADELALLDATGVGGAALLATLTDPWPRDERIDGVLTFVPGPAPTEAAHVPAWLAGATVVPEEELIRE